MANSVFRRGINNFKQIQQRSFAQLSDVGAASTAGISAIPTTPGVYRVTTVIPGLPAGTNGYGTLTVFDGGGYLVFYFVDASRNFYYAENTNAAPTKWYKVVGTEVGLTTAS